MYFLSRLNNTLGNSRMKFIRNVLVSASLVACINVANAGIIVTENFDTDGLGVRYTAEGAGGSGLGCCQNWSLNSEDEGNNSDALTGFTGADFWSGSDLNDSSLPGSFTSTSPRNLILNMVNLSGFDNSIMSVSLAASANLDLGGDFLRIFAIDADTSTKTILDFFDGTSAGSHSGISLNTVFQNIDYDLSGLGFSKVQIGFEAWTTSNSEVVGIDNVIISGDATTSVPEPSTLAIFALGTLGLVSRKVKKSS
jgi:hypothetical protein